MYWEQTAAMQVDGEISSLKKIKCGVTQGHVLSPDLFSPYNDIIMQSLEGYPRIKVGGHNVHNLRYAAAVLIRHL